MEVKFMYLVNFRVWSSLLSGQRYISRTSWLDQTNVYELKSCDKVRYISCSSYNALIWRVQVLYMIDSVSNALLYPFLPLTEDPAKPRTMFLDLKTSAKPRCSWTLWLVCSFEARDPNSTLVTNISYKMPPSIDHPATPPRAAHSECSQFPPSHNHSSKQTGKTFISRSKVNLYL